MPEIMSFARSILKNPVEVRVEARHEASVIEQSFFSVTTDKRGAAVLEVLARFQPDQSIVFCNTKDGCRAIEQSLNSRGVHCLALHGDLEQKERSEALIRFSNGSSRVLVATDVAARGLDIDNLAAVINCDLPLDADTYIHRIGRTGRAGRSGRAITLVTPREEEKVKRICGADSVVTDPCFDYRENHPELLPPMITVSINGGRKQKVSAGDILGALTVKGGIPGSAVGKIDRLEFLSFVAVKREYARRACELLESTTVKGMMFKTMFHD